MPDRPGVIRPGASGMAQGRIAQLMARAYHRTGEQRFAEAARLALEAFTVPVDAGGVLSPVAWPLGVRPMPWYVERAYPGASPWKGAALNGFMVTLLNLRAVAPLLGSRPNPLEAGPPDQRARERAPGAEQAGDLARALALRGERTLKRYLPLHDTGTWSLYGLLTPGRKWRTLRRRRRLPLLPRHPAARARQDRPGLRLRPLQRPLEPVRPERGRALPAHRRPPENQPLVERADASAPGRARVRAVRYLYLPIGNQMVRRA